MFTKREIIHLIISVFILAFVFGFDDGSEIFVFSNWLANFFRVLLVVAIVILFRELVVKLFARRHDATSEYEIWNITRVWFSRWGKLSRGFPFGIILAVVLSFTSLGNLFFTAIGIHKIEEYKVSRTGRKHPILNYFEDAQIAAMGILSSLFLAILFVLLGRIFEFDPTLFVTVSFFIALFNMLPISNLDGAKIFFGSLLTYLFLLIFLIVAFLLIKTGIIFGLVIAFLLASLAVMIYFYHWG